MLRILRQGQRWIIWGIILVVGGVFVLFIGVGAPLRFTAQNAVVAVGDRQFALRDVAREREAQEAHFRETLGEGFDPRAAADQLDSIAVEVLVQRAVLAGEAEALGLRVTDDEILGHVRAQPGVVDEDGRFRGDLVRSYAEREFGSESRYVEFLRMDLLARKLLRLLGESASFSEAEARDSLRYRLETVKLAYVALGGDPAPDAEVPDEAVGELLAKDEARARSRYEERLEEFHVPERVHVRHILVTVAPDAGEEPIQAARKRAEGIRARIVGGADFADVALETSDDPGSKAEGGDLGFVERGKTVKPFEDAAFSLEPGVLSEPVQTDFGFHLLRVEEKQAAVSRSFEEVREEVARDLLQRDAARARARTTAEGLAEAIRGGKTLVDAAREAHLTLERTDALHRNPNGFVPGLGVAKPVLDAAFALPESAPTSPRIFEVGDRLVLIQLLERETPDLANRGDEVEQERKHLEAQGRSETQDAWFSARKETLVAEGRIVYNLALLREGR